VTNLESFSFGNNPAAEQLRGLHLGGEQLANDHGDLWGALRKFEGGINDFIALPVEQQTKAAQLEYARLLRDDGFTARKLQNRGVGLIAHATPDPMERLQQSRRVTESLLGLSQDAGISEFGMSLGALKRLTRRNEDLGHLMAEHGATVGGIGRVVVQDLVHTLDEHHGNKKLERRRVTDATKDFGINQAYGFLILGDNGYYRTSDAMNGARVEMAKGGFISKLKAAKWAFLRTPASIVFTARHDRQNLGNALRTTGRLLIDLRSRKAAISGIRHHF
jgi:hypothetical protein